jgi:hypothetical protein
VIRFLFVLIGAYNLFLLTKAWSIALGFLLRPITDLVPNLGIMFALVFVAFMIIQSISIIILRKNSIKIQIIIFCIDPFIRLYPFITLYFSKSEKLPSASIIIVGYLITIIIDICAIVFLRSKSAKRLLVKTEEQRNIKFNEKLIKKNMGNVS